MQIFTGVHELSEQTSKLVSGTIAVESDKTVTRTSQKDRTQGNEFKPTMGIVNPHLFPTLLAHEDWRSNSKSEARALKAMGRVSSDSFAVFSHSR